MKYKILLVGENQTVINDFFVQMDNSFECFCCSIRHQDMKNHLKYVDPDIMVYCSKQETKDDMLTIVNFHTVLESYGIPLALLGDMTDYETFRKLPNVNLELFIQRPITPANIEKEIILFLTNKANAKRSAAGLKKTSAKSTTTSKDTLDLLAEVEAELALIDYEDPKQTQGKKRILIVDDDVSMLKTIKGHLDGLYNISTATSGALAKKFLAKKTADLILLDYEMPYESGAEVMRVLRANKQTKDIPIVFLTGVNDTAKIQEVLALKPQGYLLKPVQHDLLLQKIEEVL